MLVRAQAKLEAPLKALRGGGGAIVISTIAEITFYGTDQNGNDGLRDRVHLGELRGLGRPGRSRSEQAFGGRPRGGARRQLPG